MYVIFPFIVNEEAEIFTYFLIIIKLVSEQAGDPENSLPLDQLFALYVVYFELREHWVVLKSRQSSKFLEHTSVRRLATEQRNQQACATEG